MSLHTVASQIYADHAIKMFFTVLSVYMYKSDLKQFSDILIYLTY
jgi:hypothetical protein